MRNVLLEQGLDEYWMNLIFREKYEPGMNQSIHVIVNENIQVALR